MNKLWILSFLALSSVQAYAFELVKTVKIDDGRSILANSDGMSLYTFDVDEPGVSNCHDGCLAVWPAVIVLKDSEVKAPFSSILRADGSEQLALHDQPLYLFVADKKEGDIKGDNLQNVWHIVEMNIGGRNTAEYNLNSQGAGMVSGSSANAQAFDPVSFFSEGGSKGLVGLSEFTVIHEGVEYLFASAENMKTFITSPKKYEPTYGGWCARAMVEGQKVHINTDYFTVIGNRSFFFVNSRAKRFFDGDLEKNTAKADKEWKRISGEEARL